MRPTKIAPSRDGGDSAHELHRGGRHRALANAHRNGFARVPLLLEVLDLPLLGGHHAGSFLGEIDASLLAESESQRVFSDAADAEFFSQGIEKYVAGLVDPLLDSNFAVAAVFGGDPAFEEAAVKGFSATAIHVQALRNPFLHSGDCHDDLEDRSGRELSLNRFVEQRL